MTERPRILIVDDEVPIQDLLKTRLKTLYEVACATYQDEAFAALENSSFDLLLLDLKLPRTRLDMNPSPDVGIDVLRQVRERNICRRGKATPLPIVVITAFGNHKLLSADFLQHRGASDYVQKPFGDGKALKRKIELALCDEGAFSGPTQSTIKVVQLRFNRSAKVVWVEKFEYTGAHYELLVALGDIFLEDHFALTPHDAYRGLRSLELAEKWKIEDGAVRRRVHSFREQATKDFREQLKRVVNENDIVENPRTWTGYRLNPLVVKIVAWEQEMTVRPRPG